ncbi:MAG: hypothetical protein ACWGQW_06245 [bacterium]
MGQMYISQISIATKLDAVEDLWEVFPASQNPICIHSIRLGQSTLEADANAGMARVSLRRDTATGTATTLAARPLLPGTELADAVVKHSHTVDAAGTETVLIEDSWNVQAGWLYLPTPEERPWFTSAAGAVLRNEEIVAAATVTITVVFEEFKLV